MADASEGVDDFDQGDGTRGVWGRTSIYNAISTILNTITGAGGQCITYTEFS